MQFIELKNVVYEFVAGDRSHPKSNEIYRMVEDIIYQLRKAGYKSMGTLALQDADCHIFST